MKGMINCILIFNDSCKPRLLRFYDGTPLARQLDFMTEIYRFLKDSNPNDEHKCNILMTDEGHKVIYRHMASLFFVFLVDENENDLAILDMIQVLVRAMDSCFQNICEKDLVYNFDKINYLLDEIIQGGLVLEFELDKIMDQVFALAGAVAEENN
jgi:AP-3 complex subunit sigma